MLKIHGPNSVKYLCDVLGDDLMPIGYIIDTDWSIFISPQGRFYFVDHETSCYNRCNTMLSFYHCIIGQFDSDRIIKEID
jgi:hypothetical protein